MCIRDSVEGDPIPADEKDKEHPIPYGLKMLVSEGDHVERGQAITEGCLLYTSQITDMGMKYRRTLEACL